MVKQFVQMIVVLFVVSILVSMLANFIDDPVDMLVPEDATMGQVKPTRAGPGPDKPLPVQCAIFLKDVFHENFDKSYTYGKPTMGLIPERMPATVELVAIAALLVLVIAIPLGVYAGAYPKRASSRIIISGSVLGTSLPSFWVGVMIVYIFAVTLDKLPTPGKGGTVDVLRMNLSTFAPGGIKSIILPAITLAITSTTTILRLTRPGILENMRRGYIKFARTKGVSSRILPFGHALESTLIPMVTMLDMDLGNIIAFITITETILVRPGMRKLLINTTNKSDRPIIVAYLATAACMFMVLNFVMDLLYTLIGPRIELR